ncbi:MAG: helix-turn-helix domain-containing protein [Candidatus Colwellbacteria bacterium]|jgi:plasmid maintenance system antidote protein VapI|nr:helix-turn-helix domain-containing protein [Candidatus Colwellbacteria bacterium]MCK9497254.1 helix-turn-helix domain-containing protein [Candidatus Colwellbacteria bacterium]MDD3752396.1 helix-turn-helix domain-containing protein [Candidatus Colwellbacteria bacterium]MDD4819023.1 helix-turn-helix domain-containing protein [Candidatus Colwellbacteria bacterium]
MNNDKKLGDILSEIITEHGITLEKLSDLTNIPKRYLSAIIDNDLKNMPAAPYVRGYLIKISSALDTEPEILLDAYKKAGLKTSGKEDFLPKNRFIVAKKRKGWIFAIILGILAIIIMPRINSFLGIPSLDINLPEKIENRDFLETRDQLLAIEGKINPKDSIIINKELVPVDSEGRFTKEVQLDAGLNTFEIKVKRFLGREITVIRKVFYITENLNEENNNINNAQEENDEDQ